MRPRELLQAATRYLRRNPESLMKVAVDATALRFGIPIEALRWMAAQSRPGKKSPDGASAARPQRGQVKDIDIGSSPPALRLGATVDAMGTPVRASAAIRVDEVTLGAGSLRVGIRLTDVKLALVGDAETPIATLIKSGALDMSKPGNLIKFIPKRPPAIVEAEGDRVVVDLMRVPSLARNRMLRRVLSVISPVLGVRAIETDRDHLYVALRATPAGFREALVAIRGG